MKRLLKRLVQVIGVFLLLIGIALSIIYWRSNAGMAKRFEAPLSEVPRFTAAKDIAEGRRLYVSRGCADCHASDLGGTTFLNDPAIGRMTGANLTAGKGGSVSGNTDAEIARAIRHGIGKNGRALIFMPSVDFTDMTNEDVGKLIAYIRTAPAIDRFPAAIKAGPIGRLLYLLGQIPVFASAEKIEHNKKHLATIKPTISAEYGKYIAATCTGCHRETFVGGPIQGAPPEWPPAQNITGKALAKWSEAQFIVSIRTGLRPDGSVIKYPMPWQSLSQLNDVELKALWKYLQTL